MKWKIVNSVTQKVLAEVEAESDHHALDRMAEQAGFSSYLAAACSTKCPAGWGSVTVVELACPEKA